MLVKRAGTCKQRSISVRSRAGPTGMLRCSSSTHSIRGRYRPAVNWRLGPSKLESTMRHLGIELDDALET
jgi:hypothetical protein